MITSREGGYRRDTDKTRRSTFQPRTRSRHVGPAQRTDLDRVDVCAVAKSRKEWMGEYLPLGIRATMPYIQKSSAAGTSHKSHEVSSSLSTVEVSKCLSRFPQVSRSLRNKQVSKSPTGLKRSQKSQISLKSHGTYSYTFFLQRSAQRIIPRRAKSYQLDLVEFYHLISATTP